MAVFIPKTVYILKANYYVICGLLGFGIFRSNNGSTTQQYDQLTGDGAEGRMAIWFQSPQQTQWPQRQSWTTYSADVPQDVGTAAAAGIQCSTGCTICHASCTNSSPVEDLIEDFDDNVDDIL